VVAEEYELRTSYLDSIPIAVRNMDVHVDPPWI